MKIYALLPFLHAAAASRWLRRPSHAQVPVVAQVPVTTHSDNALGSNASGAYHSVGKIGHLPRPLDMGTYGVARRVAATRSYRGAVVRVAAVPLWHGVCIL